MVTLDPLPSKYLIDPKIPPWAGIHALLSDKQLSLKNVGFLPIIPNPVTRHDTVFTCLRNFSSICSNLIVKLISEYLPRYHLKEKYGILIEQLLLKGA